MAKIAKRVAKSREGIDPNKAYSLEEAIKLSGRKGEPAPLDWEPGDAKSDESGPDPSLPQRVEARVAVPELSHPGESQSNGSSERGVQMAEEQCRRLSATNNTNCLGKRRKTTHLCI